MKLICGLGNPGSEHALTRHNIGYFVIDSLCEKLKMKLREGAGDFLYAKTVFAYDYGKDEVVLSRPTLFMNVSGISVLQLVERFKPDLENLLLVFDDVNLPFGKIRLRQKGSHGGHKGLESVIYQLETDQFPRLRVGIGDSVDHEVLKEYVLQEFNEEEKARLPEIIGRARDAVITYLCQPIEKAITIINTMNVS